MVKLLVFQRPENLLRTPRQQIKSTMQMLLFLASSIQRMSWQSNGVSGPDNGHTVIFILVDIAVYSMRKRDADTSHLEFHKSANLIYDCHVLTL